MQLPPGARNRSDMDGMGVMTLPEVGAPIHIRYDDQTSGRTTTVLKVVPLKPEELSRHLEGAEEWTL